MSSTKKTKKTLKIIKKKKEYNNEKKILSNNIEMKEIQEIELKLDLDKTITNKCLTKMNYLELVDEKKLAALLKSKDILHTTQIWWEDFGFKWKNGQMPNERNHLINMLESLVIKHDKYYLNVLQFSKTGFGRVYPKDGLSQSMVRRELRHFLMGEFYWDIDLINAHPQILYYVCKAKNIKCEKLGEYVNKRDATLKRTMRKLGWNRDTAKKFFIAVINGSTINGFFKKLKKETGKCPEGFTKQMKEYADECKDIIKSIISLDKQKGENSLYDTLTKDKHFNKEGTFISHYLQMWEQVILNQMVQFTIEKDIISDFETQVVLSHDGMMLRKDLFYGIPIEEFIEDLNEHIFEVTGMPIKAKSKAFDEAIEIENLLKKEGIDWTEEYVDEFYEKYGIRRYDNICTHDDAITDLFYNQQKRRYRYCETTLYSLDNHGLYKECSVNRLTAEFNDYMKDFIKQWEKNNHQVEAKERDQILEFINSLEDQNKTFQSKKDKAIHDKKIAAARKKLNGGFMKLYEEIVKLTGKANDGVLKKLHSYNDRLKVIKNTIIRYTDDNFHNILDTDKNLLGFENGLYDCRTHEFRDANDGEYVYMSCGYDWYRDEEIEKIMVKIKKLVRKCFNEGADAECLWRLCARGLRGECNKEEIAMFLLGGGSNGKGILMTLLEVALGDYFGILDKKFFTHERPDGTRDPMLYGIRKARVISVAEPNEQYSFISDTFKTITGNDPITCRTNNQQKNICFKAGALFIHANHVVKFNSDTGGNSMIRRIKALNFPKKFVKEEDYKKNQEHKKNKSPDYNENIELQDADLKTLLKTDDNWKRAIMCILMDYLKDYDKNGIRASENMKKDTAAYIQAIAEDKAWFDNVLETGKFNISLTSLLEKYNADNASKWGTKKFGRKLKEFGFDTLNSSGYRVGDFDNKGELRDITTWDDNGKKSVGKPKKCKCMMVKGVKIRKHSAVGDDLDD